MRSQAKSLTWPALAWSALAGLALWACAATTADALTVNITQLSDMTFSALNPMSNASNSESVCVFSLSGAYSVTATGSGAGSAFTLSAGVSVPPLPYSVAWMASPAQTGGTGLNPGVPLSGQTSSVLAATCLLNLGYSASVTVSLASTDLQSAISGVNYTGVLTLVVTPQ